MFSHRGGFEPLRRWQLIGRRIRAGGTRRRLLTFFVLIVGAITLLPLVVAKTSLRNVVLSAALPGDTVRLTARDASLSWVSAPSLAGVELSDAVGGVLLAAERISIDRAPGNLILRPHDLGLIEIIRPTIHLKVRDDGSNLEDLARQLAAAVNSNQGDAPAEDAPSPPNTFAVHVVEGTILAEDVATGRQWRAHGVNLQYDNRGASGNLGRAKVTGQIAQSAGDAAGIRAGRFELSLEPGNDGRQQLALQAEAMPLAAAEIWLRRFMAGCELRGTLSGQGTASWTQVGSTIPSQITTAGTLSIDGLDATAPALRGDRVKLSRVELPWRIASQGGAIAIEDLQLRSDAGQAAIRGRLDSNFDFQRHDLELRGALDVARLAAMLPHALRIRGDTMITSGTIKLTGRCQPNESGQLISGSLRTSELAATSAGHAIRWDQPVNANFALRRTGKILQLDSFKCDSKFLNAEAAGTPQQFSASANFDLGALAEQLGQFVDLSGVQLAGTGNARVTWQQAARDQFNAMATGELTKLAISLADGAVWTEPQLAIRADAAGLLDPISRQPVRIDSAKLEVGGQGDELHAQLTSAVSLTHGAAVWPLSVRATGQIARWLTRARPWVDLDPWQIDGQSELSTSVRIAGRAIEATHAKITVSNLLATAPGWNIKESRMELGGDARWDGATGELTSGTAQLVTSTVSLAMRDLAYRAGDRAIGQLKGIAAFRADLARLAAWKAMNRQPPQYQPKGEFSGTLRFVQQADRITGELTATGQNLALTGRVSATPTGIAASRGTATDRQPVSPTGGFETIWQEPNLTLRGLASYHASADRLTFDQFQIQSNTLQATAGGSIEKLSSAADVNVNGTLNYDLAQISPLLRPYLGNGIQLAGREQARFALAGKLANDSATHAQLAGAATDPYRFVTAASAAPPAMHWSRRVRAQLELPWSGATVYGLPVGAGRLQANLGDGALQLEPLSLAVGEGRLSATPHVRFDPPPGELSLPAGPLITNVRISPEVSEAMLKYVAPVLAGTTQSEGQFSMHMDGAKVPLAESRRADAAGKLTVHSVRVVPGPMARELIALSQQIEALTKRRDPAALASRPQVTLLAVRDQQVNFRVVDGRVHHQGMEFQVGDVTVRSQGSVGFDETLALTLHVPIQDAWIAKEPLLAGLKGQALQVPMSGTLSRPQMDQRALAGLSQQLLQGAAKGAIGGELNKAFDKLFKSR
jgi:hypothetical protein